MGSFTYDGPLVSILSLIVSFLLLLVTTFQAVTAHMDRKRHRSATSEETDSLTAAIRDLAASNSVGPAREMRPADEAMDNTSTDRERMRQYTGLIATQSTQHQRKPTSVRINTMAYPLQCRSQIRGTGQEVCCPDS